VNACGFASTKTELVAAEFEESRIAERCTLEHLDLDALAHAEFAEAARDCVIADHIPYAHGFASRNLVEGGVGDRSRGVGRGIAVRDVGVSQNPLLKSKVISISTQT
jgi:uncharacterized ferredoxin-like protein